MNRRSAALSAAVLVVVAATSAVAFPAETKRPTVRFMYQDRIADAVSIVAVRQGIFARHGLEIQGRVLTSGPETLEVLAMGRADIATMGDTTAVIAVTRAPAVIIASHGGGEKRHRIMVRKDSPLRRPADLVGRRVAVKKGTSTYGGLLSWLRANGLEGKVRIVDMRPPDMPDALVSGAVDAIVASEPTPSVIESKGLGRELATLAGQGSSYPIMLVARRDYVTRHRSTVVRFLRAMLEASRIVRDKPKFAARVVAGIAGLTPDVALRSMTFHYYKLSLDERTMRSLQKAAGFLQAEGLLKAAPQWNKVVDKSLLREAYGP